MFRPPCRAVLMAAKALGVEVNCKLLKVREGEQNEPWFVMINPQHCVPTIDDDGFYLWESRAIMTYLANKYAPDSSLYPKDPENRAVVDRMLYFDIATLYKSQRDFIYPQVSKCEKPDLEKEAIYKKALDLLNRLLGETNYVAGSEVTLADFSILASLTIVEMIDYDLSPFPKIVAWLSKMKSGIPYYAEINDKPLKEHKEFLKSRLQQMIQKNQS